MFASSKNKQAFLSHIIIICYLDRYLSSCWNVFCSNIFSLNFYQYSLSHWWTDYLDIWNLTLSESSLQGWHIYCLDFIFHISSKVFCRFFSITLSVDKIIFMCGHMWVCGTTWSPVERWKLTSISTGCCTVGRPHCHSIHHPICILCGIRSSCYSSRLIDSQKSKEKGLSVRKGNVYSPDRQVIPL